MTKPAAPAMELEEAAKLLRLLGNTARLSLVLRIGQAEVSVADLEAELGIRQPNLSQHLADLREAGLVASRRDGRTVHYGLAGPQAAAVVECLAKAIGRAGPARVAAGQRSPAASATDGAAMFARVNRHG